MAPRDMNPGSGGALETVFDNLQIDPDSLITDGQDDLLDDGGELGDDGDQGDRGEQDAFGFESDDPLGSALDDLRVSHTRQPDQGRQQQRQPQQRPFPRTAEVKPDARGNLVGRDGQIVAKAGKEARMYQDTQRARRDLATATANVESVQGRLNEAVEIGQRLLTENNAFKAQQKQIKDFGLEPSEQISAIQLFLDLKKNPGDTLKRMLTRAAASGITIDNLSPRGGPAGFDPASLLDTIRGEISKALNPLTERSAAEKQEQERQQAEAQQRRQIEQDVKTFFEQNPEAVPHAPVFQRLLGQREFAGMTLGELWAKIQLRMHQLRDGSQPRNGRTRQIPQGRGAPAGGDRGQNDMADLDVSYDSILNGVLDQHGVQRSV